MNTDNTNDLLDELERLKVFLNSHDAPEMDIIENIPVLTDIVDAPASGLPDSHSIERQTVAVINLGKNTSEAQWQTSENTDEAATSQLRHQLRNHGRRIIKEIIDEELLHIETRMAEKLNSYLEQVLDTIQPVAEMPKSSREE